MGFVCHQPNMDRGHSLHGPGTDKPVAVVRGGARYNYHTDGLGSVTKMTDGSEGKVRSYRYDAFGRITAESGSLANFYAFTGREKHPGTSMYYYRARTYDPEVARFTSHDPAGMVDGPNVNAARIGCAMCVISAGIAAGGGFPALAFAATFCGGCGFLVGYQVGLCWRQCGGG